MPTAISYTQIGGFGLALSQIGGLSTLLFLSANKIIFRRWREEWQSTASRTGIIRVPSTVLPKTQVPTTRSPGPGLYNVRGSIPRYVPLILCGLGGIPVGPEIAQRRLPDELRNFPVGSGGPEGSVSEFHRQPSPSDFRPRGSPPRHRRIHGTQRGHRPPYFKTKSCADTRPIQDRYTSCAKTFDRTSGPIRELPLGSCPTKMGRGIGSSLVGATKQHFRIGPTARSKVSRREICLYYHGHTQDMGDAPLADMLLSKVGSMGAAPKRIGCPGLVGVQASNWVVKFVLSGGRSCHPRASPPPGGRQPPGSQGIRGEGSFPSVWAEAEEISGDSIL